MKKIISLTVLFSLFFISCSEEPKLELFSPEAFAFILDSGWEINASVNAKGFAQIEKENSDLYFSELTYIVNLFTHQDSLFHVDFDSIIDSTEDKLLDIQIESQIELDKGFSVGNYTIEFVVEDRYSNTKDTLSSKFILE